MKNNKIGGGSKLVPKHFAIQLGALIALYVSITALLVVIFNVVNVKFPDAAESWYAPQSAREAIRMGIALLVVFFPTYLILTRLTNQTRRKETHGEYTTIARWLIYISLLVSGGVLLVDLVTLINYFLDGEITTRFLIKVIALFVVVGTAFYYYVLDIRGYFNTRISRSLVFASGATLVVISALVYGFMNIETPAEVREMRIDEQQIVDLQDIQYRIEEHYRTNDQLPESLEGLYTVDGVPGAPEDRPDYEYGITGAMSYELCATFEQASGSRDRGLTVSSIEKNYNWEHGVGLWCFTRVVSSKE